ncbi:hypothetical protein TARUN_6717 [Trichoderma arundinaceum]|uniref:Uncharacterized protein n=1 Tax=Trichoderma arundinaceum TaxID=490622 RepID=A0A395NHN0_TRIAR|nr:hypothetical protein TARUN_6717 [Trichoderma arundinaceum]
MLEGFTLSRPDDAHGENNQPSGNPRLHRLPILPPVRALESLSVREKLLGGISLSFAEAQKQRWNPAGNRRRCSLVGNLQKSLDAEFHLSPSIFYGLNDRLGPETMVLPEEEEELREAKSTRRKQILTNHFRRGIRQRKLQLAFLTFQGQKTSFDFRGEPLGSVPVPPIVVNAKGAELGATNGSLTLCESKVPDRLGRVTTWVWLKICRPLEIDERPRHLTAPDTSEEREAWVIIAIPKPQVVMLRELRYVYINPDEEFGPGYLTESLTPHYVPQEGAERQKTSKVVTFKCSRNGIPSVVTSKRTGSVASALLEFRPDFDEIRWEMIRAAMMRDSCLVYSVAMPNTDWIDVAPEPPGEYRQWNGQMGVDNYAVTHAPRQMIIYGDVRRPSNLRHEGFAEDH